MLMSQLFDLPITFSQWVIGRFSPVLKCRYAHTSEGFFERSKDKIDLSNTKTARKINTHLAMAVYISSVLSVALNMSVIPPSRPLKKSPIASRIPCKIFNTLSIIPPLLISILLVYHSFFRYKSLHSLPALVP